MPVLGVDAVRGDGPAGVLAGRLPASEDEIAFGRLTAHDIGAHVGDDVNGRPRPRPRCSGSPGSPSCLGWVRTTGSARAAL